MARIQISILLLILFTFLVSCTNGNLGSNAVSTNSTTSPDDNNNDNKRKMNGAIAANVNNKVRIIDQFDYIDANGTFIKKPQLSAVHNGDLWTLNTDTTPYILSYLSKNSTKAVSLSINVTANLTLILPPVTTITFTPKNLIVSNSGYVYILCTGNFGIPMSDYISFLKINPTNTNIDISVSPTNYITGGQVSSIFGVSQSSGPDDIITYAINTMSSSTYFLKITKEINGYTLSAQQTNAYPAQSILSMEPKEDSEIYILAKPSALPSPSSTPVATLKYETANITDSPTSFEVNLAGYEQNSQWKSAFSEDHLLMFKGFGLETKFYDFDFTIPIPRITSYDISNQPTTYIHAVAPTNKFNKVISIYDRFSNLIAGDVNHPVVVNFREDDLQYALDLSAVSALNGYFDNSPIINFSRNSDSDIESSIPIILYKSEGGNIYTKIVRIIAH